MRSLRTAVLLISIPLLQAVLGQNLVPNPSFEEVTSCPTFASMLDTAAPWFNPTQGSPELFHACSGNGAFAGVPMNYSGGYQEPRTGSGFAGIYVFRGDNSNMREYIEVPLLEPLEAGACYTFSMFVNAANDTELVCDGVGVHFSAGALEMNTWQVLPVMAHIEHPAGVLINDTLAWTEVSGNHMASGGEDHLVIGNFRDDASTTWSMFNPGVWYPNMSYLLVDDVSLVRNEVNDIDLGPDTLLCAGASITLNADAPSATAVLWSDGSTEPVRTIDEAGPYAVTVQFGACSASDEIVVTTAPEPWIELGPDLPLCPGLALILASDANGPLIWDDGSTASTRSVSAPGIHRATTSNACGMATDSVTVFTEDCPEGIYLPNAFSPNGDDINDGFAPVFDARLWQIHYSIFDRWGRSIFESEDGLVWDARTAPIGVYAVQLTAHSLTTGGTDRDITGHVLLVR